jgi:hypothetical protein
MRASALIRWQSNKVAGTLEEKEKTVNQSAKGGPCVI